MNPLENSLVDPFWDYPPTDQYMTNPDGYLSLMKQKLLEAVSLKKVISPEWMHLHDSVFCVGEIVPSVEINVPPKDLPWWDAQAIEKEFSETPLPWDVLGKVEQYVKNSGANNQPR